MSKWFILMILFNVILSVVFIYSNYSLWNTIETIGYAKVSWGPFIIDYTPIGSDIYGYIRNYPFSLFWVTMIGNIIFAVLIQKSRK